jgi:phosphate transport system substrate-binding protein
MIMIAIVKSYFSRMPILSRVFLMSLLLLGSGIHPPVSAETLKYSGCGIVKKAFMVELAEAFTLKYGIPVDLKGGGAMLGIRNAAAGITHVGGSCRPELDFKAEKDARRHDDGWDAIVAIVHRRNPVNAISFSQLEAVVSGKITDWGELGGPEHTPIEFYAREGNLSGVGHMARMLIFFNPDYVFAATKLYKSSGPLESAIENDAGLWSIGLTGVSSAKRRNVKMLTLDGIYPSKENIMAGKYPALYRPLYLFTKGEPKGLAKKFIDFALSDKGQAVISKAGTVNLKEGADLWNKYRVEMGF